METNDLTIRRHGTTLPCAELSHIRRFDERELLTMRIDEHNRAIFPPHFSAFDVHTVLREAIVPIRGASGGDGKRDLDADAVAESPGR